MSTMGFVEIIFSFAFSALLKVTHSNPRGKHLGDNQLKIKNVDINHMVSQQNPLRIKNNRNIFFPLRYFTVSVFQKKIS